MGRAVVLITALTAFGVALAPHQARSDVTYRFVPPSAGGYPRPAADVIDVVTVTDQAYASGQLSFAAVCGSSLPCQTSRPAAAGWVSGFIFPSIDAEAEVELAFQPGGTLGGSISVQIDSDVAWLYQGSGTSWTAQTNNGGFVSTAAGFFQMVGDPPGDPPPAGVPEPGAVALLGIGLAGAIGARRISGVKR
jgi:hypothetical protein